METMKQKIFPKLFQMRRIENRRSMALLIETGGFCSAL